MIGFQLFAFFVKRRKQFWLWLDYLWLIVATIGIVGAATKWNDIQNQQRRDILESHIVTTNVASSKIMSKT